MNEESRLNCMQSYWKTIRIVMKMSFRQISRNILGNILNYNRYMHHPKHSYSFLGRWNRCCGAVWSGILKIDHQQQRSLRLEWSVTVIQGAVGNEQLICWNLKAIYVNMSSGNHEKSDLEWYVWRVLSFIFSPFCGLWLQFASKHEQQSCPSRHLGHMVQAQVRYQAHSKIDHGIG